MTDRLRVDQAVIQLRGIIETADVRRVGRAVQAGVGQYDSDFIRSWCKPGREERSQFHGVPGRLIGQIVVVSMLLDRVVVQQGGTAWIKPDARQVVQFVGDTFIIWPSKNEVDLRALQIDFLFSEIAKR